ncbi:MAG: ATP-binding protein [Myxococcota bacterium]
MRLETSERPGASHAEERAQTASRIALPLGGAIGLALAIRHYLAPIVDDLSLVASSAAVSLSCMVLYALLRAGRISALRAASLASVSAVACALTFPFFAANPTLTIIPVITLLAVGSFLFRPRLMVGLAALTVGGWLAIAWHLAFPSAELQIWVPAVVASALIGIGIARARHRLVVGIDAQVEEAEKQRAIAERSAKELEERTVELERTRDRALASVEAKQRFLAHMSHEIRSPLNGILGLIELTLRSKLRPTQKERLEQMRRSGDALLAIVNDLLDLSRIEAGALALESIPFDIGRVVEEVTSNQASAVYAKGLDLLVVLDPNLPARVFGDPLRLRQVINNLVGNAIKFTREGEVVVRCEVVRQDEDDCKLEFSVMDTGVGMSGEEVSRIFSPFAQADESTTREFGGTGLGLTICRQLVELMGGQLSVESAKGQGSIFEFGITVPLADTLSGSGHQLSAALLEARVLLVDANPRVRDSMRSHIESWGVDVSVAEDFDAATQLLRGAAGKDQPFTVAIVDLRTLGDQWAERTATLASKTELGRPRVVAMSAGLLDPAGDHRREGLFAALNKPVLRRQMLTFIADAHQARPVRPGRLTAQRIERQRRATEMPPASGIRVLIAEDQPTNRMVVEGFLQELGYTPVVAINGAEALHAVRVDGAFGLVLMDCQMPEMDGYTAAAAIREFEADAGRVRLPIVALTAHAFPAERERTRAAGMDAHLTKPLSIAALEEVLRRFCPPGQTLDTTVVKELANFGGVAFLGRLHASFRTSVETRMASLHSASEGDHFEQIRQDAHALKGAARQLGATRLGDLLADVEDRPADFGRLAATIEAELARVHAALSAMVEE